jgi:hypothetical protein
MVSISEKNGKLTLTLQLAKKINLIYRRTTVYV